MTSFDAMNKVVQDLREAGRVDAPTVEHALGVKLAVADDTGPFRLLSGSATRDGGLRIAIDLREPIPGKGATAGALLVLDVTGACVARQEILARYQPLQISEVPRGRSVDEATSWSREEPWGRLSFGFAERSPDCLSSVAFSINKAR